MADRSAYLIAIESQPSQFFEHARDWTELCITRQLATPLFVEGANRTMSPSLLSQCERVSEYIWRIHISKDQRWSDGSPLTAQEVAVQIKAARNARGGALIPALTIDRYVAKSSSDAFIYTKIPIAHLERVLSNPGLSPHDAFNKRSTSPYLLGASTDTSLLLRSVTAGRDIEFIWGHATDRTVTPHVKGPMTNCDSHESTPQRYSFKRVEPLDMLFCLFLPNWIGPEQSVQLHQSIDRVCVSEATKGLVVPCDSFIHSWSRSARSTITPKSLRFAIQDSHSRCPLYYADFPPNGQVARAVSSALSVISGITVHPVTCDYSQLISFRSSNVSQSAFVLSPVVCPWPHPASLLAAFYFGKHPSAEFIKYFLSAIAESNMDIAIDLSKSASDILLAAGSQVLPIGQLCGSLLSSIGPIELSPSGWVDYSEVTMK